MDRSRLSIEVVGTVGLSSIEAAAAAKAAGSQLRVIIPEQKNQNRPPLRVAAVREKRAKRVY